VLSASVLYLTPLIDLLMTSPKTRTDSGWLDFLSRFPFLSPVTGQLQLLQIHWPFTRMTGTCMYPSGRGTLDPYAEAFIAGPLR